MNYIHNVAAYAEMQVGKKYVWGTAGPDTFDCSGLVYYCVNAAQGKKLDESFRSSETQWKKLGEHIRGDSGIIPGDLLFYDTDDDGPTSEATHVGVYIGANKMVNALNEKEGVVVSVITKPYWTKRFLGAKRLFTGGRPTSGLPAPITTSAVPSGTPIGITTPAITAATPFRSIGDISYYKWVEALKGTVLESTAADSYNACKGHTALALCQAIKESSLGGDPSASANKNPLGLMDASGAKLMYFPSWPLAFAEFRKRITDPSYKGSPGPYFPKGVKGMVEGWDMSLLAYLITYVGGPRCLSSKGQECANGETYDEKLPKDGMGPNGVLVKDDPKAPSINRYCAQTLDRLRKLLELPTAPVPGPTPGPTPPPESLQRITFAGSQVAAYLPKDVTFQVILTPVGNNRPGASMRATGTAQHETGNRRAGANAIMHSNWQDAGTPGHPDGYIGVHFYVDDDRIIQKIPVNETSIHAGTYQRNSSEISIERCVNTDQKDFGKSERNAAYLQAALLKYVVKKSAEQAMYPHRTPTGTGNCPVFIGYHWSDFERRVDDIITKELP